MVLPASGRVSAERAQQERPRWWRRGFRFRAEIAGRIRVLGRDFGLARGREHGEQGRERWIGWGMLTHNLAKIAQTVVGRRSERAARAVG